MPAGSQWMNSIWRPHTTLRETLSYNFSLFTLIKNVLISINIKLTPRGSLAIKIATDVRRERGFSSYKWDFNYFT